MHKTSHVHVPLLGCSMLQKFSSFSPEFFFMERATKGRAECTQTFTWAMKLSSGHIKCSSFNQIIMSHIHQKKRLENYVVCSVHQEPSWYFFFFTTDYIYIDDSWYPPSFYQPRWAFRVQHGANSQLFFFLNWISLLFLYIYPTRPGKKRAQYKREMYMTVDHK